MSAGSGARPRHARATASLLAATAVAALACGSPVRAGVQPPDGVRAPAVAGTFYPADAATLQRAVDLLLSRARPGRTASPIAIVAPHAGYVFSGQIAADGFAEVRDEPFDVVVIVGPNHTRAGFDRVALLPGSGLRTPLGVVPLDREVGAALLKADADVVEDAGVHESEHSIEVQVPFVQRLWPRARIVALVLGADDQDRCVRLGRALARAIHGRRALLVASSDLSHYPAAADARRADARTLEAVATMDPGRVDTVTRAEVQRGAAGLVTAACGRAPIMAILAAARELGAARAQVVSYANAADVPVGEADRVVGYGAVVLSSGTPGRDTSVLNARDPDRTGTPLSAGEKDVLLALARSTVTDYLTAGILPLPRAEGALAARQQGAFVTIRRKGELRGCIGRIEADRALPPLIGLVAFESAFDDPRFQPLTAAEIRDVTFEISLLTPPRAVASAGDVVPGRDGVVLRKSGRSAVFLPQVATEQGWDRDTLLDRLCEKAGLPTACWRSGASLTTFQAEVFAEHR